MSYWHFCSQFYVPYSYFLNKQIILVVVVVSGEKILIEEADRQPPHKIDENMWKNRECMEETVFLLERPNWPEGVISYLYPPSHQAQIYEGVPPDNAFGQFYNL